MDKTIEVGIVLVEEIGVVWRLVGIMGLLTLLVLTGVVFIELK